MEQKLRGNEISRLGLILSGFHESLECTCRSRKKKKKKEKEEKIKGKQGKEGPA